MVMEDRYLVDVDAIGFITVRVVSIEKNVLMILIVELKVLVSIMAVQLLLPNIAIATLDGLVPDVLNVRYHFFI